MAFQGLAYDIEAVMPAAVSTGLFVSLCTIQQPDGASTANGSPSRTFINVTGLVAIACMDAPLSEARLSATENKSLDQVEAMAMRHVLLDSYYPAIPTAEGSGWRALIDGVIYDLLGAEVDSQRTQTRLHLRRVAL